MDEINGLQSRLDDYDNRTILGDVDGANCECYIEPDYTDLEKRNSIPD